jgi:hypothetical protein
MNDLDTLKAERDAALAQAAKAQTDYQHVNHELANAHEALKRYRAKVDSEHHAALDAEPPSLESILADMVRASKEPKAKAATTPEQQEHARERRRTAPARKAEKERQIWQLRRQMLPVHLGEMVRGLTEEQEPLVERDVDDMACFAEAYQQAHTIVQLLGQIIEQEPTA